MSGVFSNQAGVCPLFARRAVHVLEVGLLLESKLSTRAEADRIITKLF
jgi:hypothetical protein